MGSYYKAPESSKKGIQKLPKNPKLAGLVVVQLLASDIKRTVILTLINTNAQYQPCLPLNEKIKEYPTAILPPEWHLKKTPSSQNYSLVAGMTIFHSGSLP